jgi:hypothetical protein
MCVHVHDYISGAGDADANNLLLVLNPEPSTVNGCRV